MNLCQQPSKLAAGLRSKQFATQSIITHQKQADFQGFEQQMTLFRNNQVFKGLTLSQPCTTVGTYANSFDLDETQSNHNPSCLTLRQHFQQILGVLEAL